MLNKNKITKIMAYQLPALPYSYDALEPFIDKATMEIHHDRHHQAYVDNLNKALEGQTNPESLTALLENISNYSPALRNNAGGHYNHELFWNILSPSPQTQPQGALADAILANWGSLDNFKEQFGQLAMTRFGSGWTWLYVKYNGSIAICSTPNQDNPLMDINITDRGFPIMGIDVWEHAYYLKYQNKRADYLAAFWSILDWEAVSRNYNTIQNRQS